MDKSSMRAGSCLITVGFLLGGLLGLPWLHTGAFKKGQEIGIPLGIGLIVLGGASVYGGWRLRQRGKQRWGINELLEMSPSDLPGVDPVKFRAWQEAQSKALVGYKSAMFGVGSSWVLAFILRVVFGPGLVVAVIFGPALLACMLYLFLHVRPLGRRANELRKEAGIDLKVK